MYFSLLLTLTLLIYGCAAVDRPSPADFSSKKITLDYLRESPIERNERDVMISREVPSESNSLHDVYSIFVRCAKKDASCLSIEGLYFKSPASGKKKVTIVLPIYGSSEIPPSSIAAHLLDWDTNVVLLRDPGDLFEWKLLAEAKTEEEFFFSIKRSVLKFGEAIAGIRGILTWLTKTQDISPKRIGIVGLSLGAMVATTAAGMDQRISATALVMAGARLDEIFLKSEADEIRSARENALLRFARSPEDFSAKIRQATRMIEPADWASNISPQNVILFQAGYDSFIPETSRHALRDALRAPETITFFHDHRVSFLSTTIAGLNYTPWKIREFFRRRLK